MGNQEVYIMSQKVVYVRQRIPSPMFDPDPDPIAFSTIALVALILGGITTSGIALGNPNFFTQLLVSINPKIQEMTEEQIKAQREFWNNVVMIVFIILCIVGLLIAYRYFSHKKEREKAFKRYRNMRNKTLRMLRPR